MIPLKDYNPSSSVPLVTLLLIILNVVFFVLDRVTGEYVEVTVRTARGVVEVPQFIGGLARSYALVPHDLVSRFSGAWINIFGSMFLHGNWLHILSNMLYLWIFGDNIEDRLGKVRFILFYFSCGIAAALAQVASAPASTIPMVGASGAVAGVMGGYLILFPHARILTLVPIFIVFTTVELPAFLIIGYWALLQFISVEWVGGGEATGGIAYFAHIGGFVAGVFGVLSLGRRRLLGFRGRLR